MLFYKICGTVADNGAKEADAALEKQTESEREIGKKTEKFHERETRAFCFLASKTEEGVTFGLIVKDALHLTRFASRFAKHIGIEAHDLTPIEITLSDVEELLRHAERRDFIEDCDKVLARFGLEELSDHHIGSLAFGENLVDTEARREALFEGARRYSAEQTLVPELERIYAGCKTLGAVGHPVHYLLETHNRDTRRELHRILLNALYANLRLRSGRYSFLDIRPGERYSYEGYEALYRISEGGAIVVRYLADEKPERGADSINENVEHICEMAKKYRAKVLTVLCLPDGCARIKAQFYERLTGMAFIEVREDRLCAEKARAHLSALAKERHVRTDKRLFALLRDSHAYHADELTSLFEEWYDEKLGRTVYPQYKSVSVSSRKALKTAPAGTAYEELMEMVGLSEAKAVIKKALNFYKMQHLYAERGIACDKPAMHMVFSGNPGTAKTTVARLFARIMRDNGLLSSGHLVEVGRGDLVGKYVGWTAQTVQAKFKEAAGGVLFIDEAYSLVDKNDSSYGDEAINTIVQEMENRRADTVVIFAGYPKPMEDFLQKNPGLRSRVAFHVPFADYDSEELCLIADAISAKNGMRLNAEAREKLGRAFDTARRGEDFGNGRYVRTALEQARMNQASRLIEKDYGEITAEEITTITAEDIVLPDTKKPAARRIGFW